MKQIRLKLCIAILLGVNGSAFACTVCGDSPQNYNIYRVCEKPLTSSPILYYAPNYKQQNLEAWAEETYFKGDLYDIEKSLERYYYDEQKRILRKVTGQKSKESLIKVFRKEVDILNLIWFYRNIKFYHLPREQLIAYAYRGGLRVETSDIEKFSGSKNIEAYLMMVKDPKFDDYAFLFSHGLSNDLYMERRRERYLFYAFKRLFLSDNSGIGKAIAFVRLIEYEINDIVSIIESKRYHMLQDDTESFLIHQFEEEREGLTDGN